MHSDGFIEQGFWTDLIEVGITGWTNRNFNLVKSMNTNTYSATNCPIASRGDFSTWHYVFHIFNTSYLMLGVSNNKDSALRFAIVVSGY